MTGLFHYQRPAVYEGQLPWTAAESAVLSRTIMEQINRALLRQPSSVAGSVTNASDTIVPVGKPITLTDGTTIQFSKLAL